MYRARYVLVKKILFILYLHSFFFVYPAGVTSGPALVKRFTVVFSHKIT